MADTQSSTHTPGPWQTDIQTNQFSDDGVIVDICGSEGDNIARLTTKFHVGGRQMPRSEWSANARLMAAAPEMLEALRTIRLIAQQQRGDFTAPPSGSCMNMDDAIHVADAAIEKAEK